MFRKNSKKGDPQVEYQCTIRFLDDSEPIQLFFKKDTLGHSLFDQVCAKLNLVEKDYFALRYVDAEKQRHWLDPLKSVYKQLKGVNPTVLCFRVKFYPADPMKLHEEITRYHLFLQLRRDLHHGRLLCSPSDANLLAAYVVQSEVGDYDPQDHPQGYVTEFKMLPKQNSRQEEHIMELHKTLGGQVPAEAESNFLKKASSLDTYGVDPHQVKDQKGTSLYLGVTHQGIMTFHGSRRTQLYKWPQIKRIVFEGKMFIVHVSTTEDEDQDKSKKEEFQKQQPVGYKCNTVGACKYLWRCAVEQQLFFTLANSAHPPKLRSGGNIFSRGSKFRFSGRCQQEAYSASDKIDRNEPDLVRTSSLPNYTRKTDGRSALSKFNTIGHNTTTIKEDKTKKRQKESAVDVSPLPQNEIKKDVTPVTNLAAIPVIVAPMASQEDSSLDEVIEHENVVKVESAAPKKMNGSVPTHVLETSLDTVPNYEPEQTICEDPVNKVATEYDESYDTEDDVHNTSLEDQIKDLEDYITRKDSEPMQPNHVGFTQEEPVAEETVEPVKSNRNQSALPTPKEKKENDVSPITAQPVSKENVAKSKGVGCCKILFFTFFFIFVTLTVTLIVILNSNVKHPLLTELRHQLKFIDPVRDYITHKMKTIMKKS